MTRKAIPFFLLSIYLVGSTELHQLLRLPVFFEHYQEHKELNVHIGLIDFIAIHYFNGNARTPDYARDQQLPFKNDKCPEATISIALPPDDLAETPVQVRRGGSRNDVLFKSVFNGTTFHFSIWQPPRA